jgi:hypothetical protein
MVDDVLVVNDMVVSFVAVDDRFLVLFFFDDDTHILKVVLAKLFIGNYIIVIEVWRQL